MGTQMASIVIVIWKLISKILVEDFTLEKLHWLLINNDPGKMKHGKY